LDGDKACLSVATGGTGRHNSNNAREMTYASPPAEFIFDTAADHQATRAARDLYAGLSNFSLWSMMGWRDIKQRYRRSTLGPFWLTLSMGFMVLGLGLVYGTLFKVELSTYLPFVGLGLIVWEYISKCILDGSSAFLLQDGLIKQMRMPFSIHIATLVWRNIIIFGHNAVIYLVLIVIFHINPGWNFFWLIPGFILVTLNLIWIALLMAVICTRFRDVPLIVQNFVQLLFFVTPVFWSPALMPKRVFIVLANPFYHMLDVMRAPLLGDQPSAQSWIFLTVMLIFGSALTFAFFTKFRRRIAYWL
jgi:lipopolysaccharide transport system permease protein